MKLTADEMDEFLELLDHTRGGAVVCNGKKITHYEILYPVVTEQVESDFITKDMASEFIEQIEAELDFFSDSGLEESTLLIKLLDYLRSM